MRLPTQKHTLASACNLSSSGNSYLAGIIGLLIENLLILAWGHYASDSLCCTGNNRDHSRELVSQHGLSFLH
jgi:hypothetical protein